jgi:hypothetical protein
MFPHSHILTFLPSSHKSIRFFSYEPPTKSGESKRERGTQRTEGGANVDGSVTKCQTIKKLAKRKKEKKNPLGDEKEKHRGNGQRKEQKSSRSSRSSGIILPDKAAIAGNGQKMDDEMSEKKS